MITGLFISAALATVPTAAPSTSPASTATATSTATFKRLPDAELCPRWSEPLKQGSLDPKIVDESSGLSISRTQDSFYHMNDSGTGPEFHVSNPDGSNLRSVQIEDYKPIDPEETSMGPCPLTPAKTCLVIEDIGDNLSRRKSIAFLFIEEQNPWPAKVKPQLVARFKYPDHAHNAEAATLLDNGDIVIFTKELALIGYKASPAKIYRATHDQILKATKDPLVLASEGQIDIPTLTKQEGLGGGVTGMATAASGKRFTLLTYATALEFSIDLKKPFPEAIDPSMWRAVPLFQLPQQESIAYDRGDRDLVYSTEIKLMKRIFGQGQPAPMYKVKCSP